MSARYRIGQFAQLCGVTTRTLRFYDKIGVFRPSSIDPLTRYRFYAPEQLEEVASVLALRDLGISLADIRHATGGVLARGRQYDLLNVLRETLERSMRSASRSLGLVNAALEELGSLKRRIPVILKRLPRIPIASIRSTVDNYVEIERFEHELRNALPPPAVGTLRGVLWHSCADSGSLEGEAFVALNQRIPARRIYDLTELPAATLACAYSTADEASAEAAYDAVRKWIDIKGYRLTGPKRELCLDQMLEIQFPVELCD